MKLWLRTVTLSFLAVIFLATAAGAQKKIVFSRKTIEKGAVVTVARNSHSKTSQVVEMGERVQERSKDTKSKDVTVFTVIAAQKNGITEAKVFFKTKEETTQSKSSQGDSSDSKASPLAGKTFLLKVSEGDLDAKNAEGEEVTKKELDALKKEFKVELAEGLIFSPYRKMDTVIGAREVAIGEIIKVDQKTSRIILGVDDPANNFGALTLTLTGKKTVLGVQCAVFDTKLDLDSAAIEARGLTVTSAIKGEIVVAIDSLWAHGVKVKGPVNAAGETNLPHGGNAKVSLNGTVDMSSMTIFQVAKN